MFGTQKPIKKTEAKPAETPDLVVQQPANMGMPGFTADPEPEAKAKTPASNPLAVPTPTSNPLAVPVAPAIVEPEAKGQYQIVAAELLPEGMYRYIIVTNKNLGEVGGVYAA